MTIEYQSTSFFKLILNEIILDCESKQSSKKTVIDKIFYNAKYVKDNKFKISIGF